jgi:hypothetical protein
MMMTSADVLIERRGEKEDESKRRGDVKTPSQ